MKKLAFAITALALALPAAAQEKTRIGLGVSITPESSFGPTVEVYLPIDVRANLRIEPSLGIFTADSGGAGESDITIGAGVFLMKRISQPVNLYYGGRVKLNFASVDTGAADESGTDISFAGAVGGEYFLVDAFSIGLEGQLGYYSTSDVNGDATGFFTTGLGFLRVYFR